MYKVILPVRYLFKRRISYFSVVAVALCVFVVFVVITVLSGLTAEFKKNTYLSIGDCVVGTKSLVGFGYYDEFIELLRETDFVKAASPVIKNYALVDCTVESGIAEDVGPSRVTITGIDAAAHSQVTGFGQWLCYNKTDVANAFRPGYNPELVGCIPGVGLLFRRDPEGNYNIGEEMAKVKFEVTCVPLTAKGALAKAGAGEVSTKTFYSSNYVHSGLAKTDGAMIYLPFDHVQRLCGMAADPKRINAIYIKFKPGISPAAGCEKVRQSWNEFAAKKATTKQANLLEKVRVQSWKSYNRYIVAAVETEQTIMIIVFGMIGVITVFIVFVVLYMIVSHKSKDIGILKSVGVSSGNVRVVFLNFAFLAGLLGSAIGAVGGWRFLVHINQIEDWLFEHFGFQLWDRTIYAIGDIPNAIDLKVLAIIILSATAACLVGGLLPSWQAARLKPVETLQVNQL